MSHSLVWGSVRPPEVPVQELTGLGLEGEVEFRKNREASRLNLREVEHGRGEPPPAYIEPPVLVHVEADQSSEAIIHH